MLRDSSMTEGQKNQERALTVRLIAGSGSWCDG